MRELIRLLLAASEKAANIARAIRREETLFELLIEEKASLKKNESFVRDFKTLADVLIQETVRHDVSVKFPDMAENIFGEESNTFTNSGGESITITVGQSKIDTYHLLERILHPNTKAAELLAHEVHTSITLNGDIENEFQKFPAELIGCFSYSNLGIWIDPIDATSEYIKGKGSVQKPEPGEEERIYTDGGLACATVLIGVFDLKTWTPIAGVINQPFWKFCSENDTWTGRHFWGVSHEGSRTSWLGKIHLGPEPSPPVIMISDSEDESLKAKLRPHFQLVQAPGAGYKLLCVITGLAKFYVLSKSTTYRWDTCAPHAILKTLGGGIDTLETRLHNPDSSDNNYEISYNPKDPNQQCEKYANTGGIFAFREAEQCSLVLELLRGK